MSTRLHNRECDHCHTARPRTEQIITRHETQVHAARLVAAIVIGWWIA